MTEPRVITEVGGVVDEVGICLAIYGETLDPSAITGLLQVAPTESHRRGDRRSLRSPPYSKGAWLLAARSHAPTHPDMVLTRLLASVPDDDGLWAHLATEYEIQLRLGVHYTGWNKGFDIAPATLQRLARMRVKLVLDLYAYGEEEDADDAADETGM